MEGDEARDAVSGHFEATAEYWSDVYGDLATVSACVYRERLRRALEYIDALGVSPPGRVVDVGTGAGVAAAELARRGFTVTAVDVSPRMVELAKERASRAGVAMDVVRADAAALPLLDRSQDLIVALGLVPWVEDPEPVLVE